jgi:hypothetical protein
MAGCRDEYIANRDRVRAFFSEMLDDAADNYDIGLDYPAPSTPPAILEILEQTPPMLDDQIVQPMAAMSFNLHTMNSNPRYELYNQATGMFKFPSFAFTNSPDFTTSAFSSMLALFNGLLDSGCTNHIIRDQSLFYNYVPKAISIGTANCGTLEALGTGDVDF